ncbi:hypothetical protein BASA50_008867 [Batrachochytrium salamandrivorans]|uniref:Uncharacterized protein n=1 Tax=Batrachochytrium salamandrivorans TaxID=1357716 RepID=A0ABQ8F597_9FUNG|nr:hypothetical protein BASA50_008867 [Batrachochytrium salamandrivorans]
MDSMMTPIVAKSQIIQAPQSSVDLSNDPDRIYKTRSDTLEAANPIALATEESASDMVISGCQNPAGTPSRTCVTAKIKEPMDSGVDISTELDPIKDLVYDYGDKSTFTSYISIDGVYDVLTNVSSYTIRTVC